MSPLVLRLSAVASDSLGDELDDIRSLSADGHTNGDFAAALLDGVVEDAVESDGCKKQGDGGKEGSKCGQEAFADRLCLDDFLLGADVANAKVCARFIALATTRTSR